MEDDNHRVNSDEDIGQDAYKQAQQREQQGARIVLPGDFIGKELISGHGTYEGVEKQIYASMAGVVHQIDKVICVRPLRSGYRPDIGDVIVGRIVQVDQKRWMVDVNSYQHAHLALTSINLPGGVQRRRSEEDQLQMRQFFKEGDIISAEVMQVNSADGKISLQTRNQKYGKLANGFLLKADPNFIRRMKNHIMEFEHAGHKHTTGLIIGTNGYLWIYSADIKERAVAASISAEAREAMAQVRNAVLCLQNAQLPIFKDTIDCVLNKLNKMQKLFTANGETLKAKDMLSELLVPGAWFDTVEDVVVKEMLTEEAKALIGKEIEASQNDLNMHKLLEEMEEQDFIEFGANSVHIKQQ